MLDKFKKIFSAKAEPQAAKVAPPEGVELTTTPELQANLAAETNAAELASQLASATESLVATQNAFAELKAKFETAQASLAELTANKAALEAEAKAKSQLSRKTSLEAIIGKSEKSAEVLASLEGVDDATFAVVTGAMAASFDKEAKSAMFQEVGVSAEAVVEEKAPIHFNTFIKK